MNWEPWTGCYKISDAVQIAIFMGRMQNAMVKAPYKKQINSIGL